MSNHCRRATVLATIWCAVHFYNPVPGGIQQAVHIAHRESRLVPTATSTTGCMGIYQVCNHIWDSWLGRWPKMTLRYGANPYDARANIMRSIRYASESGWGPWE